MRKFFILLSICYSLIGFSQTAEQKFESGNNFYKEAKYQEAINEYLSIDSLGVHSADLYYNLGNSYYKLNQVAPTIYYFEKALKLNANHAEAKANLVFANRMKLDVIEPLPENAFVTMFKNINAKFSYNAWAWIAVVFAFLTAVLFFLYHFSFSSRQKIIYFNICILSFLMMNFAIASAYKSYGYNVETVHAIIFQQKVEVRNGPTLNSENIFQIHEGTKVEILDTVDDWKKIKLADGKTGWMPDVSLKEI